jgi:hypothetical protein
MRRSGLVCSLLLCGIAAAQSAVDVAAKEAPAAPEERWLFPRNFVRGHLDFEVAPPHNEVDLGLCYADEGTRLGPAARCAAFARYIWSGYLELQPVGRGVLRRLFFFMEPKLFGGDNLPQTKYTASPSAIILERTLGAGIELPGQFELRVTHHRTKLLGRYGSQPSAVTVRPDGPYGLYTTIGVRWYFGGYGPARR